MTSHNTSQKTTKPKFQHLNIKTIIGLTILASLNIGYIHAAQACKPTGQRTIEMRQAESSENSCVQIWKAWGEGDSGLNHGFIIKHDCPTDVTLTLQECGSTCPTVQVAPGEELKVNIAEVDLRDEYKPNMSFTWSDGQQQGVLHMDMKVTVPNNACDGPRGLGSEDEADGGCGGCASTQSGSNDVGVLSIIVMLMLVCLRRTTRHRHFKNNF